MVPAMLLLDVGRGEQYINFGSFLEVGEERGGCCLCFLVDGKALRQLE